MPRSSRCSSFRMAAGWMPWLVALRPQLGCLVLYGLRCELWELPRGLRQGHEDWTEAQTKSDARKQLRNQAFLAVAGRFWHRVPRLGA